MEASRGGKVATIHTMKQNWLMIGLVLGGWLGLGTAARCAVPDAPTNVQPAWIHSWPADFARLTWNLSPGAVTYSVYRSNETTAAWEILANGLTDGLLFDGSAGGPGRSYRVTALGFDGESAASEVVTTQDSELIPTFWHPRPEVYDGTLTATSAVFTWWGSLVTGSDGMLEIGTDLTNLTVVYFEPEYRPGFSVTVSNLQPETVYYYRITGVGPARAGNGAFFQLVTPEVNDPPITPDITWPAITDPWPVTIPLGVTDPDGAMNPLTFTLVTPPTNGVVTDVYLMSYNWPYEYYIDYTPNPGARGSDFFQYVAADGSLVSRVATVSFPSVFLNRLPQATSGQTNIIEDMPLALTLEAADEDGDPLVFNVSGGLYGTISGTAPNVVYVPNLNFVGTDWLVYDVTDGHGGLAQGVIEIVVAPVNDAPVAIGQAVTTAYNAPVAITLAGTDAESDPLSYTVVSPPSSGTLGGVAPNLTFSPATGWSGTTSFTFRVNDGQSDSGLGTVTITVSPPAAVPSAPTGLTAVGVSRTRIDLTWADTSSNEDGFKIERSSNGTSWIQIATVGPGVTSYASTGLSANKTYYYRVRAHNVLGNSAYSNTASARTLK